MSAIITPCKTTYCASRKSGTRPNSAVRWIVLHSTETAPNKSGQVARYFASAQAKGSAHLIVDDKDCYRCLDNNEVPWAAPGANISGFHIEQCAYASWTTAEWEKHLPMLHRAAYKTALHCKTFKIPVRFCTAADLKRGHKGITTHAEVSKAFPNNSGNHHDPGEGWPRALFLSLVRHYLSAL